MTTIREAAQKLMHISAKIAADKAIGGTPRVEIRAELAAAKAECDAAGYTQDMLKAEVAAIRAGA